MTLPCPLGKRGCAAIKSGPLSSPGLGPLLCHIKVYLELHLTSHFTVDHRQVQNSRFVSSSAKMAPTFVLLLLGALGAAVVHCEDYRVRIHEAGQLLELSCNVASNQKSFNLGDWNLKHTTMYGRDATSAVTMEVYEKVSSPLEWVTANKTCLPQKNPVYGGKDSSDTPIYVCQFTAKSTHYVGWVSPKDGICVAADHDDYERSDCYQVLTNPRNLNIRWVKPVDTATTSSTWTPTGAVLAREDTQQYIGRVQKRFSPNANIIGKAFPAPNRRYLEELRYIATRSGSLEILTVSKAAAAAS